MRSLIGVVVALILASSAYGDDGGTDDMASPADAAVSLTEDASATIGDMAHRPGADKASLPGCSIGGEHVAPLGSMITLGALLVLSLWARRPRAQTVKARRRARHRR